MLVSLSRTSPQPSRVLLSIQGNQVAIKYIKNPGITNFQKPSIIREFTVVSVVLSVPAYLQDVSFELNVVIFLDDR